MTEYDKKLIMYEEIEDFKKKFYTKFGMQLLVGYTIEPVEPKENLSKLEKIANQLLKEKGMGNRYLEGIKQKSRERGIVLIRSCMFKVASEMGYGSTETGRYFGFDHATVIHAIALINDLSDTNDAEVFKLLNIIRNECKNKSGDERNIRPDN